MRRFRLRSLRAGFGPLGGEVEVKAGEREVLYPLFVDLRDKRMFLMSPAARMDTVYVTRSIGRSPNAGSGPRQPRPRLSGKSMARETARRLSRVPRHHVPEAHARGARRRVRTRIGRGSRSMSRRGGARSVDVPAPRGPSTSRRDSKSSDRTMSSERRHVRPGSSPLSTGVGTVRVAEP
jgi:hypothetical protein